MVARKPVARAIALYLPQFHPIPENDEWWGTGFTEWTNTAKAKPMFRGHYQPHVPRDLGFYDLRLPETRAAQAEMASAAGVEGFCYYHYWFNGRRLLERPFNEVLSSGAPDFPFCLCWANETWTGIWHGAPKTILVEQTYEGADEQRRHFEYLLRAFEDPRYIRVDGKPLFFIYKPMGIPDVRQTMEAFRELAHKAGLPGLHLVGRHPNPNWNPAEHGFDAVNTAQMPQLRPWVSKRKPLEWIKRHMDERFNRPTIHEYSDAIEILKPRNTLGRLSYPNAIPNWDNSPRSGKNGLVLHNSTPELWRQHLDQVMDSIGHRDREHRIFFIKSWNEWAEGNHLEPDLRHGNDYLNVLATRLLAPNLKFPRHPPEFS